MTEVIEAELKDIAKQHANILKAIEQGIIPDGAKERIETLKAREEVLRDELRIAKSMEAATADRDRVLFWLENIAEVADTKTLIDVFVSKVVLLGDDLHIVMHFDDNEGPPGGNAVLDRGGGVLPDCTTLHQSPNDRLFRRSFFIDAPFHSYAVHFSWSIPCQ